ncbi:MAG: hypothetical protein Q4D62_12350 [Planctomycetia bacterium]|nr:hypothetical protein [Planctomycetia bacterium]
MRRQKISGIFCGMIFLYGMAFADGENRYELTKKVAPNKTIHLEDTLTVVYPKIVSSKMILKDYRTGDVKYGIGGQLPNRSLEPDCVSYGGLYFGEGVCVAEVTGIYEHVSERQKLHKPAPIEKLMGNGLGEDSCYLYIDKSIYLKGTEGTYTWLIPQYLKIAQNDTPAPFAYLEQKFTCKVTSDENIDEVVNGKHYKRKLVVLFTVSKNGFEVSQPQTIYYTQAELDSYLGN